MTNASAKFDQAFKDLLDTFLALNEELKSENENDEEAYQHALVESLETAIEAAIEECDVESQYIAGLLSACSEALENIDPDAFVEQDEDDLEDDDLDDDEELEELDDDEYDDDEDEK